MKPGYIFDLTYSELQAHHKQTSYYIDSPQDIKSEVFEVWELLHLMKTRHNSQTTYSSDKQAYSHSRKVYANLELKVPYKSEVK